MSGTLRGTMSRRLWLLSMGQCALLLLPARGLYKLQVTGSETYRALAEGNRINTQVLIARRGRIVSADGVVLADTAPIYRAQIDATAWHALTPQQRNEALRALARLSERTEAQLRRAARRLGHGRSAPIAVAERLDRAIFERIGLNLYRLPSVTIESGRKRVYPAGAPYAHLLGYVAPPTPIERDAGSERDALHHPDARIGRTGVERLADASLRGTPGLQRIEVDSAGRRVRDLERMPPAAVEPCTLTIDARLQGLAASLFNSDTGSATLIDLRDGAVRIALSLPGFDADMFADGISPAAWQQLRESPDKPLFNRWSAGLYPPGSIFKPVTATTLLQNPTFDPEHTIFCSGAFKLGERNFHCWKRTGHGDVNLTQALQHSCDVYFYQAALGLSADTLATTARACGLGRPSGLMFPGERTGTLPDTDSIARRYRRAPAVGDVINAVIGQGLITMTPLQAAIMASALACDGRRPVPRLLRDQPPAFIDTPIISPLVRAGMNAVCNDPTGTAYAARLDLTRDGLDMAGKTGTAQVRRIGALERLNGVIDNAHLPRHLRDHAWFIAYAPVLKPRYAAAVLVEHGSSGSGRAAPIVRDLLRQAAALYGV